MLWADKTDNALVTPNLFKLNNYQRAHLWHGKISVAYVDKGARTKLRRKNQTMAQEPNYGTRAGLRSNLTEDLPREI